MLLKNKKKELKYPMIYVFYGPPGTGKTNSVYECNKLDEIYRYTYSSTG